MIFNMGNLLDKERALSIRMDESEPGWDGMRDQGASTFLKADDDDLTST
jgi:hypothetical protein